LKGEGCTGGGELRTPKKGNSKEGTDQVYDMVKREKPISPPGKGVSGNKPKESRTFPLQRGRRDSQ